MGFLRRLLGTGPADEPDADRGRADRATPVDHATLDDEERARELELARFEQDRLDELVLRQQRYADRSWIPPAQGGERRADDEDAATS